jgi:hypothetical protein
MGKDDGSGVLASSIACAIPRAGNDIIKSYRGNSD